MKRYNQLTTEEKLTLTDQSFADSVKLEALDRGIKPEVTLSEALRSSEWHGYQIPTNGVRVWTLDVENSYGNSVGYLNAEQARAALEGAVVVGDRYSSGRTVKGVYPDKQPSVREVLLHGNTVNAASFKLEDALDSPDPAYVELVKTCSEDWHAVLQAEYDGKVRATRWAEYLRLAQGDAAVAAAFWQRAGEGSLPEGVITV